MEASKVSPRQAPSFFILAGFSLLVVFFFHLYLPPETSLQYSCLTLMLAVFVWAFMLLSPSHSSPKTPDSTPSAPLDTSSSTPPFVLQSKDLEALVTQLNEELQEKNSLLKNYEEKLYQCKEEIEEKKDKVRQLEGCIQDNQQNLQELKDQQEKKEQGLLDKHEKQDLLLKEYQTTITQQREIIEKKQRLNTQLETKVKDLSYEIKALLQLEDFPSEHLKPSPLLPHNEQLPQTPFDHYDIQQLYETFDDKQIKSPYDAFSLLEKYRRQAEKFPASGAFNTPSLPQGRFHLDLRHLFEILENEQQFILLLYSQMESKIVFTNKKVRDVLGYNPESFCHNFPHLIQKGKELWQQNAQNIQNQEKKDFRMILKSYSQEDMLFHLYLEKISKGIFNTFSLAILIPK